MNWLSILQNLQLERYIRIKKLVVKIHYDLIENALDFILSSIKFINQVNENKEENISNKANIKYSILHLSSGLELLFKERLRLEHWSLIFDDINKANRNRLKSGDFKSVTSDVAQTRLKEICEVEILDIVGCYKRIRNIRNKIEHFEFKENLPTLNSLIADVLVITIDFIDLQLKGNQSLSKTNTIMFDKIKEESSKFSLYTNKRFSLIQPSLIEFTYVLNCSSCGYDALALREEDLFCFFCNEVHSSDEESMHWNEKDRFYCLEGCNKETVVPYSKNSFLCLTCAYLYNNLAHCRFAATRRAGFLALILIRSNELKYKHRTFKRSTKPRLFGRCC